MGVTRKTDINKKTKRTPEFMDKYNHSGVYVIYINDILVYIGQSINMVNRITQHMTSIKFPENVKTDFAHKYYVLREAYDRGCQITFDVLYYSDVNEPMELTEDLYKVEGEYLRKFIPPLNYSITDSESNKTAATITLDEILKLDKGRLPSAYYGFV